MIDSMHVLDVLRTRGYTPQDEAVRGETWFDLRPGQRTTVRVVLQDDGEAAVMAFTGASYAPRWTVRLNADTPGEVLIAVLELAEGEARPGTRCTVQAVIDTMRGLSHAEFDQVLAQVRDWDNADYEGTRS